MTEPAPPSSGLVPPIGTTEGVPRTVRAWEAALCRRFLVVGGTGDATPIRSLEVTPITLAEACGFGSDDASAATLAEVEAGFKAAFRYERSVAAALEHGSYGRLDRDGLPGCFTYLALSLFVDSLLDEEYAAVGAYREKLDAWLGFGRSFSNLRGVALMWEALRDWLDRRSGTGEPFRRLVLPDPGAWSHIGYTRRLSFPSRRDVRLVAAFLHERPVLLDHPRRFLTAFQAAADSPGASWGLKQAFSEFRDAYLAGGRALGGHRFWQLVTRFAGPHATGRPTGAGAGAAASGSTVEMTFDEDDERVFTVVSEGDDPAASEPTDLGGAVSATGAVASSGERGVLLFSQIGYGRWRATPGFDACFGRILVGCPLAAAERLAPHLGPFVRSGDWAIVAEPVGVGRVEDALARAGMRVGRQEEQERIVAVAVGGGVPVAGGAWLGRPRFLPWVRADAAELGVELDRAGPNAEAGRKPRIASVGGAHRFEADEPFAGAFRVKPRSGRDGHAVWTRRVSFVRDAAPHDALGGAAVGYAPLRDWAATEAAGVAPLPGRGAPGWDPRPTAADDLLEAVYAGGRTGWDEARLAALIADGVGGSADPWTMLRCLSEAAFLQPRLRPLWRGRVWTLEAPGLVALAPTDGEAAVVAQGALCVRMVEDFRSAAEGAGGRPFRRLGPSTLAPALIGCTGGDPALLSDRLGWPLSSAAGAPGGKPFHVATTQKRANRYVLAGRWDWARGRFVNVDRIRPPPSGGGERPIGLSRWVHPGGRDHDLYVVEGGPDGEVRYLSRTAAVVAAHSLARAAMFEFDAAVGRLLRRSRDGGLPDAVAARLRLGHLLNPGPVADGYAYPCGAADAGTLGSLLPGLVAGLPDAAGVGPGAVLPSLRHSGGRMRATWSEGRMAATPRGAR